MSEEQHQYYLNLINLLLTCTQDQEIEILQANPDLHDTNLVRTILTAASNLIKQKDFNSANRLMNIAGVRLGVYLHSSGIYKRAESDKLFNQGTQQFQGSQFDSALKLWKQAMAIDWVIGDRQREGGCLNSIGQAYYSQGEYKKAISCLEQAVSIAKNIGYREGEAQSSNWLGSAYGSLGYYQKAIQYHQAALKFYQDIGDCKQQGDVCNNLGNAYRYLGEYSLARRYNLQALIIAKKSKDDKLKTSSLANLGLTLGSIGKRKKSIKYHEQCLKIARKIKDEYLEATALGNLGGVYQSLGKYQTAIEYQQQDLAIAIKIKDRKLKSNALDSIGTIYYKCGEHKKAIDYILRSLNISRQIEDRQGQSSSLVNLGTIYQDLRQLQESFKCFESSLTIKKEIGDVLGEAICLGNLGNFYFLNHQYQEAIKYYEQDLKIVEEIGSRQGEVNAFCSLGAAYYALGDIHLSLYYSRKALVIAEKDESLFVLGTCLHNIGYAHFLQGMIEEARDILYRAVCAWESLRADLRDAEKISIFEGHSISYLLLQEVLVALNRQEEALEVAERGRTRAFVELLIKRKVQPGINLNQISWPSSQKIREIAHCQNYTIVEYSIVDSGNKLLIWVILPNGIIQLFQKDIKSLQKQNISLSSLVTQARDFLNIAETKQNESILTNTQPSLANRDRYPYLQQLYQFLIEPIKHLLPTKPEVSIVIVPQSILFLVPFSALQNSEGEFLIERYTTLTIPSIQVLELTHKRSTQVSKTFLEALVVGNPKMPTIPLTEPPVELRDLPWAKTEANAIAPLLNTQAITGSDATKAYITPQMSQARLIHLATHGLLDDIRQLGIPGAVALAPSDEDNGFLTAGEIYDLELNAELVVLSACSTGQGKITGDGVVGLSRCLIAAGVKSVIVSLWSVGDLSTALMMVKFYQIFQQGVAAAIALNEAQRWLLGINKTELAAWVKTNEQFFDATLKMSLCRRLNQLDDSAKPFANPRHWAAFFAIGK
ncbi:MAG: tetratricopeptide repeat protein [Symploca sp. SIO2D2]|nr:tetratricopeptide repeat protein [Symploca sp. SIO2D2]